MSSFHIDKCDVCGLESRFEFGVSYQPGSADDPETKMVRIRGYHFCLKCGEPILKGLGEVLYEKERRKKGS